MKSILYALFPWANCGSPEEFAEKRLKDSTQQRNISELEDAAKAVKNEGLLKELRDLAKSKMAEEDSRQALIIGRAQALFVALAFFGVLSTFGTSFLTTKTDALGMWPIVAWSVLTSYVLIQIFIMVRNIRSTIDGIKYPTVGSSDLAKWLKPQKTTTFLREHALMTLAHYRKASLNNSWRFHHFTCALMGLRNIVLTLVLLIFLMVAVALAPTYMPCIQKLVSLLWAP